jgi:hypothetical protein
MLDDLPHLSLQVIENTGERRGISSLYRNLRIARPIGERAIAEEPSGARYLMNHFTHITPVCAKFRLSDYGDIL